MIVEEDLETIIDYFRTACVKNDIKKPVIVNFLDFLASRRDDLCLTKDLVKSNVRSTLCPRNQQAPATGQSSLLESLEHQKMFDRFIQHMF